MICDLLLFIVGDLDVCVGELLVFGYGKLVVDNNK